MEKIRWETFLVRGYFFIIELRLRIEKVLSLQPTRMVVPRQASRMP